MAACWEPTAGSYLQRDLLGVWRATVMPISHLATTSTSFTSTHHLTPFYPPTRSLALERAREMGLLISARIRGCMIAPALI